MSSPRSHRLWFVTGEDPYFVTYNLLVLLRTLGYAGDRMFRDHRKFAFLVDFVADASLVGLATRTNGTPLSARDHASLSAAFMRGVQRMPMTSRLVVALARRRLLRISNHRGSTFLDVSIHPNARLSGFLRSRLFTQERRNIAALKPMKLGFLTQDSLLDRLFHAHGVAPWVD